MSKDDKPYIPETEFIPLSSARLREVAKPAPALAVPPSPAARPHTPPPPIVSSSGAFYTTDRPGMETTLYRLQDTRYQAMLTLGVLVILLALITAGVYLLLVLLPGLGGATPP